MNIRDQIIEKKVTCIVTKASEPQVSGKVTFYMIEVDFADPKFPELDGLATSAGSFQVYEVGQTYEIEFKKGKREDSLVAYRKASTDEEKAARKAKEEAEKLARKEKERKEKEDYEALMAKEGGPGMHTNAADSKPSASLIIEPSDRHMVLGAQYGFAPNDIKVMEQANILPRDTPIAVAELFFRTAQMQGLNPLLRQIYLIPYGSGERRTFTQVTAIDSMRAKALATKEYTGKPKILYDGLAGSEWKNHYNNYREYETRSVTKKYGAKTWEEKEVHLIAGEFPTVASATVMRTINGVPCPFEIEIFWDEYYPGPSGRGQMWRDRPFGQFGKCAEAIALRVAFADALSRMYVAEEFDRAAAVAEVQDVTHEVIDMQKIRKDLDALHTVAELQRYRDDHPEYANNGDILEALANRHREINISIE